MLMLDSIVQIAFRVLAAIGVWFALSTPGAASPLVTGNGFGFAVVAPESGIATKFYTHPYSFLRADPANALGEGVEAANFIKKLGWGAPRQATTAEYVDNSHVIRVRRANGRGYFFMPFGFERPALIIDWETAPRHAAGWRVEWNRPVKMQKVVNASGAGALVLRFDGIDEVLLLIPLGGVPKGIPPADQPLAASPSWALISIEDESEAEPAIREFVRWRAGLPARELVERELAKFEKWRAKPPVHFKDEKERHLWRQSEA
ncbi:MAG: hypothetical protein ABIW03_07790, partial [Sphingomicrobium sp.]